MTPVQGATSTMASGGMLTVKLTASAEACSSSARYGSRAWVAHKSRKPQRPHRITAMRKRSGRRWANMAAQSIGAERALLEWLCALLFIVTPAKAGVQSDSGVPAGFPLARE